MKQINLIPPEYAHSRYVHRRITIWIELTVAIGAMVGALGFNLYRSAEGAERQHKRLEARAAAFKQISAQLHAVAAEKKTIIEKLTDIYAIRRKRICSVIFSDIAAACNERVFLTELVIGPQENAPKARVRSRDENKTAPEPQEEDKTVLKLVGSAMANLDLTRFVSDLAKSAALGEVKLKFWRQDSMGALKLIKFEIECHPHVEANAQP